MTNTKSPNKLLTFFLDIFFLALITAFSWFLIGFYKNANLLNTGYPDWLVHAFRIKQLQNYGFQPWTHKWANGIDSWRSYQFIPHYITLAIVEFFILVSLDPWL